MQNKKELEENFYWKYPKRASHLRSVRELAILWYVLISSIVFIALYPIANHLGYWTSAIPAAIVLGFFIASIIVATGRQREE